MNNYSLASDSRRWWWPSAAAGTAGAGAIVAMLVLPVAVQAQPEPLPVAEPAYSVVVDDSFDRPCFMIREPWNEALDAAQPTCSTLVTVRPSRGVWRPGLSYEP